MVREIKWGTNSSDLPDMVLMGAFGGGKRAYIRNGENLSASLSLDLLLSCGLRIPVGTRNAKLA
jgi:hypothetical protein